MKCVEDNVDLTEGEISAYSDWRLASIIATSSWGQDGVGWAARWGEAVGVALPESSGGSSVVGETPAVKEWGNYPEQTKKKFL